MRTYQLKLSDEFPPHYHQTVSKGDTTAATSTIAPTNITASQCQGPHKNNLKQIIPQGFHPNIQDK